MAALEIKNVTKKFGKKTVIDNMSFEVEEGEIYGFLGPNGSGKTTLIKCIMGLLGITSGNILVNGIDISKDFEAAAESFGGIIENPEMYGDLKGIDNLKFFSALYPNVKAEDIDRVISLVGLDDAKNMLVKKYSLGMKQRLGIALAIINNPKLLVLDEPTNGLDPKGIKELRDILRNLAANGTAVFVSSHMLAEMELMCDRVCIISKGKVIEVKDLRKENKSLNDSIEEETFKFVYDTSEDKKAYIIAKAFNLKCEKDSNGRLVVEATKGQIAYLTKEIAIQGIEIYTVSKNTKSLEQIYIETCENKAKEKENENI